MDKDLDALEEALTYIVRAFKRPTYWQMVQQSAKVKLDRPSAYLLSTLSNQAIDCRLNELADIMGVEAPSITRMVQHLEKERLVSRVVDPIDRRVIRVQPTPQGLKTVACLREAKRRYLKTLLKRWPVRERQELVRLLQRLAHESMALVNDARIVIKA